MGLQRAREKSWQGWAPLPTSRFFFGARGRAHRPTASRKGTQETSARNAMCLGSVLSSQERETEGDTAGTSVPPRQSFPTGPAHSCSPGSTAPWPEPRPKPAALSLSSVPASSEGNKEPRPSGPSLRLSPELPRAHSAPSQRPLCLPGKPRFTAGVHIHAQTPVF